MDEISYICDSCGEEIVIPVDPCEGSSQEYVEDCPVCCNPMVIEISIDPTGSISADCRGEQDRFA
jgi:DNA replicative helicase MCM subunit Mcm2 (Cdc46/Mcm family)